MPTASIHKYKIKELYDKKTAIEKSEIITNLRNSGISISSFYRWMLIDINSNQSIKGDNIDKIQNIFNIDSIKNNRK